MWYRKAFFQQPSAVRTSDRVLDQDEYTWHVTPEDYTHPLVDPEYDGPANSTLGAGSTAFGPGFYTSQNRDVMQGYYQKFQKDLAQRGEEGDSAPPTTVRRQRLPRGTRLLAENAIPHAELSGFEKWVSNRYFGGQLVFSGGGGGWFPKDQEQYDYKGMSNRLRTAIDNYARSVAHDQDGRPTQITNGKATGLTPEQQKIEALFDRGDQYMLNGLLHEYGYDGMEYSPYKNFNKLKPKQTEGNNILVWNDLAINDPREFRLRRFRPEKARGGNPRLEKLRAFQAQKKVDAAWKEVGNDLGWLTYLEKNDFLYDLNYEKPVDLSSKKEQIRARAEALWRSEVEHASTETLEKALQTGDFYINGGGSLRQTPVSLVEAELAERR